MTIRDVKIGDFCLVGDGAHSSIKRTDIGIMYLSSKNFSKDGITLDKVDYISNVDYEKYFKGSSQALTKPKKDDLIFSIIGSIGGVYLYKKDDCFGLSSSVAMIRVNSVELDAHYLFFYLKSNFLQQWAEIIKSGSAQGFLSLSMIRSLPLLLPPLKTQQKIASILSNYDKLIENNTQRIKLLESMAEELYKEWFVRLRFPGYEDVEVVDGLPVGWERNTLNNICEITSSKRIFLSDYTSEGIPFYRGKEITLKSKNESTGSELFISDNKFHDIDQIFGSPSVNDILITAVGTLGSIYLVKKSDGNFYFKDGNLIWLKKFKNEFSRYIYYFCKSVEFQHFVDGFAIGSSQKALTIDAMKKCLVVYPKIDIVEKFNTHVKLTLDEIEILQLKNQTLKQTRDLLLPRLMSGKLNVEDLDII